MVNANGRTQRNNDDDELDDNGADELDPQEYDAMMQLERLESLEEEMMEMEVTTLDEIRQRIGELHRQMDEEESR